jgi:hypothetical protein
MIELQVGDALMLRCKPGCALTPNGYRENSTWSIADRIVATVRFIKGDLVAIECNDDSYHEDGFTTRVLHRRAIESCLIEHIPLPQPTERE